MDEFIEVIVKKGGGIEYKAVGYAGPACEKATQFIRDALKGSKIEEERTSDYWLAEKQKQSQ